MVKCDLFLHAVKDGIHDALFFYFSIFGGSLLLHYEEPDLGSLHYRLVTLDISLFMNFNENYILN